LSRLGGSENAPIILGRPFLATAKAIIYADAAKIIFSINGRKERFNCKDKILEAPAHPRYPYPQEHEPVIEKKRRDRRRNKKNNQPQSHVKEVLMINTIQSENKKRYFSHYCESLKTLEFHQSTAPSINGTSSELSATRDQAST
jgi:hypothetical protein